MYCCIIGCSYVRHFLAKLNDKRLTELCVCVVDSVCSCQVTVCVSVVCGLVIIYY